MLRRRITTKSKQSLVDWSKAKNGDILCFGQIDEKNVGLFYREYTQVLVDDKSITKVGVMYDLDPYFIVLPRMDIPDSEWGGRPWGSEGIIPKVGIATANDASDLTYPVDSTLPFASTIAKYTRDNPFSNSELSASIYANDFNIITYQGISIDKTWWDLPMLVECYYILNVILQTDNYIERLTSISGYDGIWWQLFCYGYQSYMWTADQLDRYYAFALEVNIGNGITPPSSGELQYVNRDFYSDFIALPVLRIDKKTGLPMINVTPGGGWRIKVYLIEKGEYDV